MQPLQLWVLVICFHIQSFLNLWRLMGIPQAPAPPHLYPQQLQLKLYQAFIFSIPILFSIILFLLFYLFYLKRRASSISSPPHIIPGSSNQATLYHASSVRPLSISLSHAPNACKRAFLSFMLCFRDRVVYYYGIMVCCSALQPSS